MSTQSEDRKLQFVRVNQYAVIVIVLFMTLIARLWYLQIAMGDELLQQSESNRIKLLRTRAPRGTILDCKGRVLATSRPQFVVMVVPEALRQDKEAEKTLCEMLHISRADLDWAIQKRHSRPGSPVRVKIDVPLEVVARIDEMRMKLPGVSVELDQIRYYPDGPAVAHIMGYLGEIDEDELDQGRQANIDYMLGDYVGKAGLEKQYERDLRGIDGGNRIEVNAFGRVVRVLGERQSIAGKTLRLSIDRDLQIAANRAMGNQIGACVAVDPRNGAVLAMVSKPSFDPNIFVKRVKASDWNTIIRNKGKPLQNRCVSNVYPPGSTFKPIVAIAGLVFNKCNVQTTVSCSGYYPFGRRPPKCWKVHGGGVNFMRAMAESCDVWFYGLGRRLEIDRIAEVARQFGIGSETEIDLPSASCRKGTMPDTKWKRRVFHERWWPGETLSCAIGQGFVLASPLQMALMTATVANSGTVYRPRLVQELDRPNGELLRKIKPDVSHRVNAPVEYFALVSDGMRQAVTAGTGRVCNMPDITVCGKTGSAEATRAAAHGWFICYAPKENPKIAIACIVEHGRHGATTAAPVCRAVLDVYFGKKKPQEIGSVKVSVSGD